jgi:succinate dehydrogenase/fumarate reductase cytochrome b subunit
MADHGTVEYATAAGNDGPAHEATYENFVHLAFVGSCFVVNIVIMLAIGAVAGHWGVGVVIFLLSFGTALHGFASGARAPIAVMIVVSLLTLALVA